MQMNKLDEKVIRQCLYNKINHALSSYDEDLNMFHDCVFTSIDEDKLSFSLYYIKEDKTKVGIVGIYDILHLEVLSVDSNVKINLPKFKSIFNKTIASCLAKLTSLEHTYHAIWLHSSEYNEREDNTQYVSNDNITRAKGIDIKGKKLLVGIVLTRNYVWKKVQSDFEYESYSDARKALLDFEVGNPDLQYANAYFKDLFSHEVMPCIMAKEIEIRNLVNVSIKGNYFKLQLNTLPKVALRNDRIEEVPLFKIKEEVLKLSKYPQWWRDVEDNATVLVNRNKLRILACCLISQDNCMDLIESFEQGKHHAYNLLQYLRDEKYNAIHGYSTDSALSFWKHLGCTFYKNIEDSLRF